MPAMPFSVNDRELLGGVKGVGPMVIARLEQMGFSDLEQLAVAGVQDIVEKAAALVGSSCWKNSPQARAAIEAAILAAAHATSATHPSEPLSKPLPPVDATGRLASMANLGPKSAAILAAAGIDSPEHLARLGSVAAFAMAKRSGARVSLNLLWAIEGALSGQSWQSVAREHRASLLLALDSYRDGA